MEFTIDELRVMWIIGVFERLATLGILNPDVPYQISKDAIDQYLLIDEHRDKLFYDDDELGEYVKVIIKSESDPMDDDEIKYLIRRVIQYKNDRETLVKDALESYVN